MRGWGWFLLLAAPPLGVLTNVLANLALWPRGREDGELPGPVSVLIPARDEEARVAECVRAVLSGRQAPDEVLVYDDGSTDATPAILARLAEEDPRVRVLTGGPLPPGWVGKPHACHQLALAATGELLLFLDADTVVTPGGLARLGSVFAEYEADLVTAGVRQVTGSFGERLVIPLLHLSYLAWLPLPLIWRARDPRFLIANGQLLAVRRAAYEAAGGWAAVRAEVVDDVAFGRRVKQSGGRVVFADGSEMAAARMYQGAREVWQGFSKNLYEGIGGRPLALAVVAGAHLWIFVLPYFVLPLGWRRAPALLPAAAVGVAANLGIRAALALRLRHPPEGILLHPLGILALLGIALNSFRWSRRGAIHWRGRSYAARPARDIP